MRRRFASTITSSVSLAAVTTTTVPSCQISISGTQRAASSTTSSLGQKWQQRSNNNNSPSKRRSGNNEDGSSNQRRSRGGENGQRRTSSSGNRSGSHSLSTNKQTRNRGHSKNNGPSQPPYSSGREKNTMKNEVVGDIKREERKAWISAPPRNNTKPSVGGEESLAVPAGGALSSSDLSSSTAATQALALFDAIAGMSPNDLKQYVRRQQYDYQPNPCDDGSDSSHQKSNAFLEGGGAAMHDDNVFPPNIMPMPPADLRREEEKLLESLGFATTKLTNRGNDKKKNNTAAANRNKDPSANLLTDEFAEDEDEDIFSTIDSGAVGGDLFTNSNTSDNKQIRTIPNSSPVLSSTTKDSTTAAASVENPQSVHHKIISSISNISPSSSSQQSLDGTVKAATIQLLCQAGRWEGAAALLKASAIASVAFPSSSSENISSSTSTSTSTSSPSPFADALRFISSPAIAPLIPPEELMGVASTFSDGLAWWEKQQRNHRRTSGSSSISGTDENGKENNTAATAVDDVDDGKKDDTCKKSSLEESIDDKDPHQDLVERDDMEAMLLIMKRNQERAKQKKKDNPAAAAVSNGRVSRNSTLPTSKQDSPASSVTSPSTSSSSSSSASPHHQSMMTVDSDAYKLMSANVQAANTMAMVLRGLPLERLVVIGEGLFATNAANVNTNDMTGHVPSSGNNSNSDAVFGSDAAKAQAIFVELSRRGQVKHLVALSEQWTMKREILTATAAAAEDDKANKQQYGGSTNSTIGSPQKSNLSLHEFKAMKKRREEEEALQQQKSPFSSCSLSSSEIFIDFCQVENALQQERDKHSYGSGHGIIFRAFATRQGTPIYQQQQQQHTVDGEIPSSVNTVNQFSPPSSTSSAVTRHTLLYHNLLPISEAVVRLMVMRGNGSLLHCYAAHPSIVLRGLASAASSSYSLPSASIVTPSSSSPLRAEPSTMEVITAMHHLSRCGFNPCHNAVASTTDMLYPTLPSIDHSEWYYDNNNNNNNGKNKTDNSTTTRTAATNSTKTHRDIELLLHAVLGDLGIVVAASVPPSSSSAAGAKTNNPPSSPSSLLEEDMDDVLRRQRRGNNSKISSSGGHSSVVGGATTNASLSCLTEKVSISPSGLLFKLLHPMMAMGNGGDNGIGGGDKFSAGVGGPAVADSMNNTSPSLAIANLSSLWAAISALSTITVGTPTDTALTLPSRRLLHRFETILELKSPFATTRAFSDVLQVMVGRGLSRHLPKGTLGSIDYKHALSIGCGNDSNNGGSGNGGRDATNSDASSTCEEKNGDGISDAALCPILLNGSRHAVATPPPKRGQEATVTNIGGFDPWLQCYLPEYNLTPMAAAASVGTSSNDKSANNHASPSSLSLHREVIQRMHNTIARLVNFTLGALQYYEYHHNTHHYHHRRQHAQGYDDEEGEQLLILDEMGEAFLDLMTTAMLKWEASTVLNKATKMMNPTQQQQQQPSMLLASPSSFVSIGDTAQQEQAIVTMAARDCSVSINTVVERFTEAYLFVLEASAVVDGTDSHRNNANTSNQSGGHGAVSTSSSSSSAMMMNTEMPLLSVSPPTLPPFYPLGGGGKGPSSSSPTSASTPLARHYSLGSGVSCQALFQEVRTEMDRTLVPPQLDPATFTKTTTVTTTTAVNTTHSSETTAEIGAATMSAEITASASVTIIQATTIPSPLIALHRKHRTGLDEPIVLTDLMRTLHGAVGRAEYFYKMGLELNEVQRLLSAITTKKIDERMRMNETPTPMMTMTAHGSISSKSILPTSLTRALIGHHLFVDPMAMSINHPSLLRAPVVKNNNDGSSSSNSSSSTAPFDEVKESLLAIIMTPLTDSKRHRLVLRMISASAATTIDQQPPLLDHKLLDTLLSSLTLASLLASIVRFPRMKKSNSEMLELLTGIAPTPEQTTTTTTMNCKQRGSNPLGQDEFVHDDDESYLDDRHRSETGDEENLTTSTIRPSSTTRLPTSMAALVTYFNTNSRERQQRRELADFIRIQKESEVEILRENLSSKSNGCDGNDELSADAKILERIMASAPSATNTITMLYSHHARTTAAMMGDGSGNSEFDDPTAYEYHTDNTDGDRSISFSHQQLRRNASTSRHRRPNLQLSSAQLATIAQEILSTTSVLPRISLNRYRILRHGWPQADEVMECFEHFTTVFDDAKSCGDDHHGTITGNPSRRRENSQQQQQQQHYPITVEALRYLTLAAASTTNPTHAIIREMSTLHTAQKRADRLWKSNEYMTLLGGGGGTKSLQNQENNARDCDDNDSALLQRQTSSSSSVSAASMKTNRGNNDVDDEDFEEEEYGFEISKNITGDDGNRVSLLSTTPSLSSTNNDESQHEQQPTMVGHIPLKIIVHAAADVSAPVSNDAAPFTLEENLMDRTITKRVVIPSTTTTTTTPIGAGSSPTVGVVGKTLAVLTSDISLCRGLLHRQTTLLESLVEEQRAHTYQIRAARRAQQQRQQQQQNNKKNRNANNSRTHQGEEITAANTTIAHNEDDAKNNHAYLRQQVRDAAVTGLIFSTHALKQRIATVHRLKAQLVRCRGICNDEGGGASFVDRGEVNESASSSAPDSTQPSGIEEEKELSAQKKPAPGDNDHDGHHRELSIILDYNTLYLSAAESQMVENFLIRKGYKINPQSPSSSSSSSGNAMMMNCVTTAVVPTGLSSQILVEAVASLGEWELTLWYINKQRNTSNHNHHNPSRSDSAAVSGSVAGLSYAHRSASLRQRLPFVPSSTFVQTLHIAVGSLMRFDAVRNNQKNQEEEQQWRKYSEKTNKTDPNEKEGHNISGAGVAENFSSVAIQFVNRLGELLKFEVESDSRLDRAEFDYTSFNEALERKYSNNSGGGGGGGGNHHEHAKLASLRGKLDYVARGIEGERRRLVIEPLFVNNQSASSSSSSSGIRVRGDNGQYSHSSSVQTDSASSSSSSSASVCVTMASAESVPLPPRMCDVIRGLATSTTTTTSRGGGGGGGSTISSSSSSMARAVSPADRAQLVGLVATLKLAVGMGAYYDDKVMGLLRRNANNEEDGRNHRDDHHNGTSPTTDAWGLPQPSTTKTSIVDDQAPRVSSIENLIKNALKSMVRSSTALDQQRQQNAQQHSRSGDAPSSELLFSSPDALLCFKGYLQSSLKLLAVVYGSHLAWMDGYLETVLKEKENSHIHTSARHNDTNADYSNGGSSSVGRSFGNDGSRSYAPASNGDESLDAIRRLYETSWRSPITTNLLQQEGLYSPSIAAANAFPLNRLAHLNKNSASPSCHRYALLPLLDHVHALAAVNHNTNGIVYTVGQARLYSRWLGGAFEPTSNIRLVHLEAAKVMRRVLVGSGSGGLEDSLPVDSGVLGAFMDESDLKKRLARGGQQNQHHSYGEDLFSANSSNASTAQQGRQEEEMNGYGDTKEEHRFFSQIKHVVYSYLDRVDDKLRGHVWERNQQQQQHSGGNNNSINNGNAVATPTPKYWRRDDNNNRKKEW